VSDPSWGQEASYREAFLRINQVDAYSYQVRIARLLSEGRNVTLRAPTGSGKTKAVLTPFLTPELAWNGRPTRLIYALPLRSLVQQIHIEARALLQRAGRNPDEATIQTGEQPDDELFDRGQIIVTTYDQILSGLLCAPYGLSKRLRNVNAAAVAGALLVFDEFHLMGITTALLTGAAGLRLLGGVT
jgi:CRISPR-associated endonuclease/helicase Cas3